MFDRFTDRARKVMSISRSEAIRVNHEYIGTGHILLTLIKEGGGTAVAVLNNLGFDLVEIIVKVEGTLRTGLHSVMLGSGSLPFTTRAKKVLELASEEATQLGHNYTGTEHLLLGLIGEQQGGKASSVLKEVGVELDTVRDEVRRVLSVSPEEAEAWEEETAREDREEIPSSEKPTSDLLFMASGYFAEIAEIFAILGGRYRDQEQGK